MKMPPTLGSGTIVIFISVPSVVPLKNVASVTESTPREICNASKLEY
jgi:hypothetical protein